MAKKPKQRPHIGRCIAITDTVAAGVVLYRLVFWKPTRTINGRPMFAKPHSELEFETGLSAKQIKTALNALRNAGFIVTGQHLFHGRNVMHVAVTATCWEALDGVAREAPTVPLSGPEWDDTVGPSGTASYTTYKQGEEHGVQQEECELALAGGSDPLGNLGSGEKQQVEEMKMKKEKEKKPRPATVAEYMAQAKSAPKSTIKLHKPETSKALELVWVQAVSEATGKYVPPLTMKEVGLLTHVRAKCPKGKAAAVIRYVVANWIAFVKTVETEAGLKTTPSEPRLQFLLLHAGIAINMMAPPKSKPKVKQEAQPVAVNKTTPVQLIANQGKAGLTKEDALKLLLEDDE